jgi:ligand-binding SRPBCC domain-containing protein
MPTIHLSTTINAPIELVFDLARSIDLHAISLDYTNEKAVAGRISGLVEEGETVTWEAKHFGITQQLTSKITDVRPHHFFADEMASGAFKSFKHEHRFEKSVDGLTLMTDVFEYESPLWILGKLADMLFLKRYMTRLLETRNLALKQTAENAKWKELEGMKTSY